MKVLSEEDHVSKMGDELNPVWLKLREKLVDYADTSFSVSKGYISWKRENTAVCFIHFRTKRLKINILRGNVNKNGEYAEGFFTLDDPKEMASDRSWIRQYGSQGHEYTIGLQDLSDLDYVMFLLEQKYNALD